MSSPTSATTVARNPGENNAKRDFADFGKSDTVMEGEDPVTITDPSCCASLIFNGVLPSGDEALISIPYPFSNFEPKTIELDEGAAAALASGMEDTNPLDYSAKSHSLLATPRAFISTDASSAREACALETLKCAQAAQYVLEKNLSTTNSAKVLGAERVRVAEEAVKRNPQSTEIQADRIDVTLNADENTFTVAALYTNLTGVTASAAVTFPRLDGLTLQDSRVDIHGYNDNSKYLPLKDAEEVFERLSACNAKGASIAYTNKQTYTETLKIPAWSGVSGGASTGYATFTAYFVLSCDDIEESVLLLPSKAGCPKMGASDYIVQPPYQGNVPFTLKVVSRGTSNLSLPSHASATLDAKLQGVPTYWIKPPLNDDGEVLVNFNSPSLVAPLFRFRFVNETDDCDIVTAALENTKISNNCTTGHVLCFSPTSDRECVALVELSGPLRLPDNSNAQGRTHHVVEVMDLSGSMGLTTNGSSYTNRILGCSEIKSLCAKLHNLPREFAKANITSPNDNYVLTVVVFHSRANVMCSRVPIISDSEESKSALAKVAQDVYNSTETGGTNYSTWATALQKHVRKEDCVTLCLLTDGALHDRHEFTSEYKILKNMVREFSSCAIGCGAWANYDTVKLVATHGEAVIEQIDSSVSSTAMRLMGKCIASMATKFTVVVEDQVLSDKGANQTLPSFSVTNSTDPLNAPVHTTYKIGIGGKRVFAVRGTYDGGTVNICAVKQALNDVADVMETVTVNGSNVPIDNSRVLRHLDQLFVSGGVSILKHPSLPGLNANLLTSIGVHNQTTTSHVVKVAEYDLGTKYDNKLDSRTKATVTPRATGIDANDLPWMRAMPNAASYPIVATNYVHKPLYEECCTYGLGGLSGSDEWGATRYRSLQDDAPVFVSLSAGDCADVVMAPSPPPSPAQEAEVEVGTDENATPTFMAACPQYHNSKLLPFLKNHKLVHCATADLLNELHSTLSKLRAQHTVKTNSDDPMDDILNAALDKVAGPSIDDITTKLWPLQSTLRALVMRYHIVVDINMFDGAIPEGDLATAIHRTEYLTKIATRLHDAMLMNRPSLWRAQLTTEELKPTKHTFRGSLTWVQEDNVRANHDTLVDNVKDAITAVSNEFAAHFNRGGYGGGIFVSDNAIYTGVCPPATTHHTFTLGEALVPTQKYNTSCIAACLLAEMYPTKDE